jgi:hypothetical protein
MVGDNYCDMDAVIHWDEDDDGNRISNRDAYVDAEYDAHLVTHCNRLRLADLDSVRDRIIHSDGQPIQHTNLDGDSDTVWHTRWHAFSHPLRLGYLWIPDAYHGHL